MVPLLLVSIAAAADLDVPSVYPTINDALAVADEGDTIVIAAGSYCEDVIVDQEGLTIEGAGMGLTILDGSCGIGSGVLSVDSFMDSLVLRDLTVDGADQFTGFIINDRVDVVAERVAFVDGFTTLSAPVGGGVRLNGPGGSLLCVDCLFCDNDALDAGGAVFTDGAVVELVQTVLVGNGAGSTGGGVYVDYGGTARLVNNTFVANEVLQTGAAVRVRDGSADLVNNLIVGHQNIGGIFGPAFAVDAYGGGVGEITGTHTLFWDNLADADPDSDLDATFTGQDPLLADGSAVSCDRDSYQLLRGSPAINVGHPDGASDDIGAIPFDDEDGDGYEVSVDCDDTDPAVHPDAAEVCNGFDDDCDELIDDADPDVTGQPTWYGDGDGDGFGDADDATVACDAPPDAVADDTDCDDGDASVNPDAVEVCDGVDNDCSSGVDDGLPDADADGVCDALDACEGDDASGDGDGDDYCADLDCDDAASAIYPGAQEVCSGVDDDCDGLVDDADDSVAATTTWYVDSDGDSYGDDALSQVACDPGSGWVTTPGDCDDTAADAYPGAYEYCDGRDRDCDDLAGTVDPDVEEVTWYLDSDGDGFGQSGVSIDSCEQLPGYARQAGDCDDDDPAISPDAVEVCGDGIDQDCAGGDLPCGDSAPTGDTGGSASSPTEPGSTDTGSGGTPGTSRPADTGLAGDAGGPAGQGAEASDAGLATACGCAAAPGPASGIVWLLGGVGLAWRRRRAA